MILSFRQRKPYIIRETRSCYKLHSCKQQLSIMAIIVYFSFSELYFSVQPAKFKSFVWIEISSFLWTHKYNKYLTNLIFSAEIYGP